jgi:GMP synthase-like glutamine amidotransferase
LRVLGLQHIACEHPGAFAELIDDYVPVELDAGEPLPRLEGFDAVVAMGGPMSVNDEDEHPWLVEEKAFVREVVEAGVPFLGVCLGSQLLASALGARVYANPAGAEVGMLPVQRTDAGRADPLLGGLAEPLVTLQWHGDTFDLPEGAELLATSPLARHQAFRVGARAYGVQFHLEVTEEQVGQWAGVPAYADSLRATLGDEAGRAFLADAAARASELAAQARALFAAWLALAQSPDDARRAPAR